MKNRLVFAWALLAATPLAALLSRPFSRASYAILALYGVGALMLRTATRRDPEGRKLATLGASTEGRVALVALVAVPQLFAFLFDSAIYLLLYFVLVGTIFFGVWAVSSSAERLSRLVSNAGLAALSFAVLFSLGETFFRIKEKLRPPVEAAKVAIDDLTGRNPHGWRTFHTAAMPPKAKGTRRILVLGDSFTYGQGIEKTEDIWPYVLEKTLNDAGLRVEVINFGLQGYTTVNEAEALAKWGDAFSPDLVLLQHTLNDPLPSGPGFQRQLGDWLFPPRTLLPIASQQSRSLFYRGLDEMYQNLGTERIYNEKIHSLYDDNFFGWKDCRKAVGDIAAWTKQRGVSASLVVFPLFFVKTLDDRGYPFLDIHEKLRRVAEEEHMTYLDVRPLLAKEQTDGKAWYVLPGDDHPNLRAHRITGEAVARQLLDSGWGRARPVASR